MSNFDIDLIGSRERYYGNIKLFDIDGLLYRTIYYRNKTAFDEAVAKSKKAFKRFEQHIYPVQQEIVALKDQDIARIEILRCTNGYFSNGQIYSINEANKVFAVYDVDLSEKRNKYAIGSDGRYIGGCRTEFMLHLPDSRSYKMFIYFGESNFKGLDECISFECNINIRDYLYAEQVVMNSEIRLV